MEYKEYKVRVHINAWVIIDGVYTILDSTTLWINKDDELHRENGPAVERTSGYKAYYFNGKPHRNEGPAIIYPNGDKYYYINGASVDEEEFYKKKEDPNDGKIINFDGKKYTLTLLV